MRMAGRIGAGEVVLVEGEWGWEHQAVGGWVMRGEFGWVVLVRKGRGGLWLVMSLCVV